MELCLQIKGDPAIRKFLFQQERNTSKFDESISHCHKVLEQLITHHGIFHLQMYFSRSQILLWQSQFPFEYQVHKLEELLSQGFTDRYPLSEYPEDARIPREILPSLFERCKILRFQDDVIYLRSGSINIYNGLIGLNFSCDGTHYVDYQTFLNSREYGAI